LHEAGAEKEVNMGNVIDLTRLAEDWPGMKTRIEAIPTKEELFTMIDGRKVKEEIVKAPLHEDAELAESGIAGMFSKVSNIEILNIPIGQAAIGGFGAVFASELIDGFMSTQSPTTRGLVKLAGAAGVVMFGKKLIGSGTAKVIALLLTFDAIRDLTPIDEWATKLSTMVTKVVPTAGLGTTNPPKPIAVQQAQQILSSTQRASMRG
jgi:hypothetical protein